MKKLLLPLFFVVCLVGDIDAGAITVTTRSELGNISTRGFVQTGDNILDGGFIIEGSEPKTVIVRAVGPSLTQYGVPSALADPTLELHAAGNPNPIAFNDNWQTTVIGGLITSNQVSAIQNSGYIPGDTRESAIIATLQPGLYTAIVRGKNNTTGVALVEVYYLETAPIPLTPLTLATTGLDTSSPVSVHFFNSAGFSFTDNPIRVERDGTVVVAVPLYIDPVSNQVTSGKVSMVLRQGTNSSPPVSLEIQNLPTLDSYGTQLGEISHALLVMNAILQGQRLNQLQAAQLLFNSVDTTPAQAIVSTLLGSTILARNDVDRVMHDHTTVITGTLTNGAPIQFDHNSLEMMDRVSAVYLTQLANAISGPLAGHANLASGPATRESGAAFSASSLESFIEAIEGTQDAFDVVKAAQDLQKSNTVTDAELAVVQGVNSYLGLAAKALENAPLEEASKGLGFVLGAIDVVHNTAAVLTDLQNVIKTSAFGTDPALFQEAVDNLKQDSIQFGFAAVRTGLETYVTFMTPAGPARGAIAVVGFALTALETYSERNHGDIILNTARGVADEIHQFLSPNEGFGEIEGIIDTPGNPQASIELCCIGAGASEIQGITDPSGNYELFVPLDVPNTTYNNLALSDSDLISHQTLGFETVDLSGLDTSHPLHVPILANLPPPLNGTWVGTWQWSGPTPCGCPVTDGGSFSMELTQTGTSFSGATSGDGIQDVNCRTCEVISTDGGSGTISGTMSGTTLNLSFDLGNEHGTLSFTGTATFDNNTITASFVRTTGGSGSFTVTKQ